MSNTNPPFPPNPPGPPGPPNNPYGQNPYGQNPYGNNPYQQNPMGMQRDVPNATAILVLGIVSIVTCWCYGIIGLGCGIAALVMANKAMREYQANPAGFTTSSYNNAKGGKICAIIGTILSGLYMIYIICMFAFLGSAMMSGGLWNNMY
ncbi:MAG TPA: CCC motif membrane protein [Bacteroidia bacterium]|nr:CCC motif membrane protein [Bacteroidia bacterium]